MPQHDRDITIKVNGKDVTLTQHRLTGADIKKAAIEQGINIQSDFSLFEVKNKKLVPVGDNEEITVNNNSMFRAIAPDDNS